MYKKTKFPQIFNNNKSPKDSGFHLGRSLKFSLNKLHRLQQTFGNQIIQRWIKSGNLQPKLKIGKPNDKYEQEADRVSDQVMRMPDKGCPTCPGKSEEEKIQTKPLAHKITPLIQRDVEPPEEEEDKELVQSKLTERAYIQRQGETEEDEKLPETEEEVPEKEDEEAVQTKPVENAWVQRQGGEDEEKLPEAGLEVPEKEDEETAQTKAVSRKPLSTPKGLHHQIQSMKGGGKPIPSTTRRYFESRFGANFRNVRVHTGSQAEKVAGRIRSRAFTLKNNIFFGSGQYSPNTKSGKKLLAHELIHVVQQDTKPSLKNKDRVVQRAGSRSPQPRRSGSKSKECKWARDPESFSMVVATHYLATEYNIHLLASRVVRKKWRVCTVWFKEKGAWKYVVRVNWRYGSLPPDPPTVWAQRIKPKPQGKGCTYSYTCGKKRKLNLKKQSCS